MTTFINALCMLRPNAEWTIFGDDLYENIVWRDKLQTIPSKEELLAKISELENEYNAKQYQRNRAKEYPSIADQLDKLYHDGYDGWKQMITEIKEQYPKPE